MRYCTMGNALMDFQRKTATDKTPGIQFVSFRCKTCGKSKPTKGRKSLGRKAGFECAECAR